MKYCINCGAELPDEAVFCKECGSKSEPLEIKTEGEVTNVVVSDEPPVQPQQPQQPQPQPQPRPQPQPQKPALDPEAGRKRGIKGFLIPVIIVILVAWIIAVIVNTKNGVEVDYHPNQKVESVG